MTVWDETGKLKSGMWTSTLHATYMNRNQTQRHRKVHQLAKYLILSGGAFFFLLPSVFLLPLFGMLYSTISINCICLAVSVPLDLLSYDGRRIW